MSSVASGRGICLGSGDSARWRDGNWGRFSANDLNCVLFATEREIFCVEVREVPIRQVEFQFQDRTLVPAGSYDEFERNLISQGRCQGVRQAELPRSGIPASGIFLPESLPIHLPTQ